ncbi:MAG: NAD(P)/FAD-dependent oxidoreductase [Nitrospinales bacterium]
MSSELKKCDVLVIGGGPAGSTVSTLLVEKGWNVTLLEKEKHPRFHIGESLLPMTLPLLKMLGVEEKIREIGIIKYGAEFTSSFHNGKSTTFYFRKALDKNHPYAYQVRRSEFDHILLENSKSKGVDVHEGICVKDVQKNSDGKQIVSAESENGEKVFWSTDYIVDATGRDTFMAKKFGTKKPNFSHNSAAVFSHFENVERLSGEDEGNISVMWFDHGWFWMIPFLDGTMSVGAVCWPDYLEKRKTGLDQFLLDTIALCPGVAKRCRNAKMVMPSTATGNYSYKSDTMAGDGYIMIGDAFAFVDPVFSSGVHLAMTGGVLALEVVDAALRKDAHLPDIQRNFEKKIRSALETVSWFIYRITQPAMRDMFMTPKNIFRMEEAVLSLLAGDIFGGKNIRIRLLFFKIIYYAKFLFGWEVNRAAFKRRQRNIDKKNER